MGKSRISIPEAVKRAVRQRCGFGCIFCGAPIYDYDHIEPFSVIGQHDPENLTLLCPNHHREKTAGRLSVEIVRNVNSRPRNCRAPYTAFHNLYFSGASFRLCLGSIWFSALFEEIDNQFDAIIIDENPLLSFYREEGRLLLAMKIHEQNGETTLDIEKSQLRHSTNVCDVTFTGSRLVVRQKDMTPILDLLLHPPDGIEILRANFRLGDRLVVCTPMGIFDELDNGICGGRCEGARYGIVTGKNCRNYPKALAWL